MASDQIYSHTLSTHAGYGAGHILPEKTTFDLDNMADIFAELEDR